MGGLLSGGILGGALQFTTFLTGMRQATAIYDIAQNEGVGVAAFMSMAVTAESLVTPGSKAAGLDACVAPTAFMRRSREAFDIEASVLEGERLRVKDEGRAYMHGGRLVLDIEEGRVERA